MTGKMLRYGITLAAICAVAALGVAGTYYFTALKDGPDSPIPSKLREKRDSALHLLFGSLGKKYEKVGPMAVEMDVDGKKETRDVFAALDDQGKVMGWAGEGAAKGYSSLIRVIALTSADKKRLLAVLITNQAETPGLGTRISDVATDVTWAQVLSGDKSLVKAVASCYEPPKSLDELSDFQRQFIRKNGIPVDDVKLAKGGGGLEGKYVGIDAVSGATVSSRAAVSAVDSALQAVKMASLPKPKP